MVLVCFLLKLGEWERDAVAEEAEVVAPFWVVELAVLWEVVAGEALILFQILLALGVLAVFCSSLGEVGEYLSFSSGVLKQA